VFELLEAWTPSYGLQPPLLQKVLIPGVKKTLAHLFLTILWNHLDCAKCLGIVDLWVNHIYRLLVFSSRFPRAGLDFHMHPIPARYTDKTYTIPGDHVIISDIRSKLRDTNISVNANCPSSSHFLYQLSSSFIPSLLLKAGVRLYPWNNFYTAYGRR
jgi:hypothetical protein